MNWFQGENDIRAKFEESEAGARRSNELRQLDELHSAKTGQRTNAIVHFRARVAAVWSQLLQRKPAPRTVRGGGSQPRVARVFRKK